MIKVPAVLTILVLTTAGDAGAPGVRAYGAGHPACLEWSDGCTVCRRIESASPACSTPGIACRPRDIQCDERGSTMTK